MFTLHNGDCLEYMKSLQPASDLCIVTDPPYNTSVYFGDKQGWNEYRAWLKDVLAEFERITNNIFVFHSPKVLPQIADLFDGYDSFAAVRNFAVMGYGKIPNAWDIAFYKCDSFSGSGRNWALSNTAGMLKDRVDHPTQKTEGLMNYVISLYSCPIVFDPFMGSGTTGVSSLKLGRQFIGCELEPKYFQMASKRIKQAALSPSFFTPSNNRLHPDVGDSPAQQALFTPEADTAEGKSPKPAPRR